MGSSYFGEPNMGNERASGSSSTSSSSSRKGRKNSNSDKPRQPQRGLGVAQLEKIRLHSQMAPYGYLPTLHASYTSNNFNNEDPRIQMAYPSPSPSSSASSSSLSYSSTSTSYSASYGFQPNIMMGLPEHEKTNIRYGDYQSTNTARLQQANAILGNQCSAHPNMTMPFLNLYDSHDIDTKKHKSGSMGSSSQNSETSDTQELDLELRLSL